MPRTVDEILAQADELAKRFEDYEPKPGDAKDATPLREVSKAFEDVAFAEKRLRDAVIVARSCGFSWAQIGARLGTSGEAARSRYGESASEEVAQAVVTSVAATKKARVRGVKKATVQRRAKR